MVSRVKIITLLILYLLFYISGLLLVYLDLPGDRNLSIYNIGSIFGIWALTSLSLQFVLSSRLKIIEKGIGLDRVMRFHSLNAKLLMLYVLLHPLLLGMIGNFKAYSIYHWMGFASVVLLIITLFTTLFSKLINLDYEFWKLIHKLVYVILLLGVVHSYYVSGILFGRPLFYWWLFLILIAFLGVLSKKLRKTYAFRIDYVIKENHNVWTVKLSPEKGGVFNFSPGQFAFVRFFGDISSEEHHFTISSSPGENFITFSIKELGDYTSKILFLKKGDRAIVDGPYGVFTNVNDKGLSLFVAGGIGITPFMSMIRFMSKQKVKSDTVLLFIVKNRSDLIFSKVLNKISKEGWLKIIYRFTESEGHVDTDFLEKIENILARKIYLVGPSAMMKSMGRLFLNIGIHSENIMTEKFSLK